MFASRYGDGHTVVLAGRWLLDPTAEQFGAEGPYVCRLFELPDPWYALEPEPDTTFAASELALIGGLAGDYRVGESNKATAVLAAMDLVHLEQAVRETARTDSQEQRPCFCGAPSVGWYRYDSQLVWGCVAHFSPVAERANVTTVFEGLGFDPSRGGGDGGRRGLGCDRNSTPSRPSGP